MRMDGLWVLFCFLPLFLAVYHITPEKEKKVTLLAGSIVYLFFFVLDGGWRAWSLIALIPAVYVAAYLRRPPVGLGLCFAVWSIYALGGMVPFWVRFLLLQASGVLLEVRRGWHPTGGLDHGISILMFPKLSYGPYVPPGELAEQIAAPKVSWRRSREGLQELVIGFAGLVLLGGWIDQVVATISVGMTAPGSWARVMLSAMSFYFRFAGASAMAVGTGKLLGYELPEGFRQPWCAESVVDYFSRWNMSLWRWMDLLLGISGKRGPQKALVLLIAGVVMGAWYGPGTQTLLWGIFIGVVMATEQGSLKDWIGTHGVLARIYTLVMVLVGWGIFFVEEPAQLLRSVGGSVGSGVWWAVIVGAFFCSPIPSQWVERYRDKRWFDGALVLLFWVSLWFLV